MNLILIEPHELAGNMATIRDQRASHIRDVLSGRPGGSVRVGLLGGPLGVATILETGAEGVSLSCEWEPLPPPVPPADLLLALPRPKVMRRLWAQLSALGVGHVALTNADKVERNYFDTHYLDEATYRPLLIEGLQQARDTHLPRVSVHKQLKPLVEDLLDELFPGTLRLIADPGARTTVADAVRRGPGRRFLLAIGPEGGWTDYERGMFMQHGFEAVGMGTRTLRTDTACIALIAQAYAHGL
ncbi:MAG: RsmE family RNA methyltransferase [Myxococcota bacterium]|jgi:RsmE family RNA methyltransferase